MTWQKKTDTNNNYTSIERIFGGESTGRSSLSVSISPIFNKLYNESPVTYRAYKINQYPKRHAKWLCISEAVVTLPNMVCFRSSQSQRSRVIKNWLPFVCGALEFAHATKPLWLNLRRVWNSSANVPPYILSPPENSETLFIWQMRSNTIRFEHTHESSK